MEAFKISLHGVDWGIIIGYCILSIAIGVMFSKKGTEGVDEYFVAGRSLPWWVAGTSMVATTFAADTPLVISGVVRTQGLQGNWFYWGVGIGYVILGVIFAKFWNRARMVTDAEFCEFRYDGNGAKILRGFNACFQGIVRNCIIMSWVMLAMTKIMGVIFDLPTIVMLKNFSFKLAPSGAKIHEVAASLGFSPDAVLFSVDEKALTIVICITIAMTYSTIAGMWGVVVTDLVQFGMAMFGAIALAVVAVQEVGGLGALREKVVETINTTDTAAVGAHALCPSDTIFSLMPNLKNGASLAIITFIIYISLKWWEDAQGSNYIAQRIFTCKNAKHSMLAVLWYDFLHIAIRFWPWIITGLASIVIFPKLADPEMAYPMMIGLLPIGIKGILVASLLAAFMSTIDTHMNWGSSYMVVDVYKRFIKKKASEKHYVFVGQIAGILLVCIAGVAANYQSSVFGAWMYLGEILSGVSAAVVLRWFWWRVNAWSEITAMLSALILTNVCRIIGAYYPDIPFFASTDWFAIRFLTFLIISTIAWITVTMLTAPVSKEHLKKFYEKVKPFGFWDVAREKGHSFYSKQELWGIFWSCVFGVGGIFFLLLGIGKFLITDYIVGLIMIVCGIISWILLFKFIKTDKTLS